jgi:hypothetical protein
MITGIDVKNAMQRSYGMPLTLDTAPDQSLVTRAIARLRHRQPRDS